MPSPLLRRRKTSYFGYILYVLSQMRNSWKTWKKIVETTSLPSYKHYNVAFSLALYHHDEQVTLFILIKMFNKFFLTALWGMIMNM
mgnify:FL=1